MSKLIATRTAQYPLVAEFSFNFNDTMVDVGGVTRDFGSLAGGSLAAGSYVFEAIPLPANAVVIGGDITTEVGFDAVTYTVAVGDSADADRYLAATDVKAAGRVPLVPTGFRGAGENLRLTITPADACTAGKASVRLQYIIKDRVSENAIK